MTNSELPADLFHQGLGPYVKALKAGEQSAVEAVQQCLQRAKLLEPRLNAFAFLAEDQALQRANKIDQARQQGNALGPLAGVPIGVKDIYVVDGMPTSNGSRHPNHHLNGAQGQVISHLQNAGCIILGKTRTVEYALGATGINQATGTPVNPWDSETDRIPGGSSSGSAVAVSTGMCAFALGSDTGGSIRNPASLNGLVGHKTTVGRWPTDGLFPLSKTLDSAGALTRTVADAALVHSALSGEQITALEDLKGLRLGRPQGYFLEELDDDVRQHFELASEKLASAGVLFCELELPEARERDALFPQIVPPELIARLTVDGFNAARQDMDSVTRQRAAYGLEVSAVAYLQAQQRMQQLRTSVTQRLQGLDGWLAPTCPFTAMPIRSALHGSLRDRALMASRNTMPVNIFGQTALTIPIAHLAQSTSPSLPTGLQLVAAADNDANLLSIGMAVEQLFGTGDSPDLSGFLH